MSRVHRRFTAWLAMCVMVFAALAPTVAQAMVAASDDGQWVEVCSASGMVWLKADGVEAASGASSDQDDNTVGDMGSHCPWCSFHVSALGLLPQQISSLPLVPAAQAVPHVDQVALTSKVQRRVQARAPPFAS